MARVHAANASLQSHTVRGLARSLSHPAYQRLLNAEPFLRRVVPLLIVAFLAAVAVGAAVQIAEHRRETLADAEKNIALLARAVADDIALADGAPVPANAAETLNRLLPPQALGQARRFFLSDQSGRIIASAPPALRREGTLASVLGDATPLAILGERAGVMEVPFEGDAALATVRSLRAPFGQIAVIQPKAEALARWRTDAALTVTLVTTTGFVLLILGFAFHWQASRAREADVIYEVVRTRFDTALNRGRCGLWDWDLARGRIYWSDSMFEILGLEPREELMSFGEVDALVHPDDGSLYEIAAGLADTADGIIDRAFRMRHARGDWVWLRARCELVRQEGGRGPHLIGIAVDITEEQRLAARTATADMRLRDAVENISEAFVLWDADNRLVLCNTKFEQLHGLPEAVTQPGTPYEDVIAAGRQPVIRNPLRPEDKLEEGVHSFEAQLGDGRWLKISERRTKDGGYVSVGTDITAIKRHEERLVESEKRLMATIADQRQAQQTLEYQAQQLADLAQKYAEEKNRAELANRAKSEFLANMSHELRTPLNAIIGFSEIMEQGMFGALGSDRYEEYCKDIHASGAYLLDVINDILDMSKIEAGRIRLDVSDVRLDEIVAEAMRVMSLKADEKQLTFDADVTPGLMMRGDRRALKQILLNLLSNAIKFTLDGGKVSVRGRLTRNSVMLVIEDSGIGIPRVALRKLGRPFEQVESHFTKTHQGSGLGLAIAKSLAELHGGAMRIRSIEGMGTTVIVRFPHPDRSIGEHTAIAAE
ncbi:MAG TPA: ATP-binding protein [Xanthobacteraceae bacterium]|nr:ATP-binding protein [Xanthobacteraceae bacterium]